MAALTASAHAYEFPAHVTDVVDGDTVWVLDNENRSFKIRLLGIDAPESDQDWGQQCTTVLARYVLYKPVSIIWDKRDRYGRLLGTVVLDGGNVNLQMVKDGCAWVYRYYDKDLPSLVRKAYYKAEDEAKQDRLNLWQDDSPIEPWQWRRGVRVAPSNDNAGHENSLVIRGVKAVEKFLFHGE